MNSGQLFDKGSHFLTRLRRHLERRDYRDFRSQLTRYPDNRAWPTTQVLSLVFASIEI